MSWKTYFDHVAIASKEPEKLKKVLKILGLHDNGTETVATQNVETSFFGPEASSMNIEILEPINNEGTVAQFLQKKGSGIHHISFRVTDLDALIVELHKHSIRLIYSEPQIGAHSCRINFIHPESTGGVLIEVSEKLSK